MEKSQQWITSQNRDEIHKRTKMDEKVNRERAESDEYEGNKSEFHACNKKKKKKKVKKVTRRSSRFCINITYVLTSSRKLESFDDV